MERTTLKVMQAALVAIGSLLIVPFAVNVATGGELPDRLEPIGPFLWPAAIACVVLIVALEVLKERQPSVRFSARRPNDPRNVDRAVDQVARYVAARRENSLAEHVRITLTLGESPAAVRQPAHLVRRSGDDEEIDLTDRNDTSALFHEMSESVLILGEPGAGKTTLLLDLAESLIEEQRTGLSTGIPVVVDLAEWARSRARRAPWLPGRRSGDEPPREFRAWLISSLQERYGIPAAVGRIWLDEHRLVLLLDGLDEVGEAQREQCVGEINALHGDGTGAVPTAVCSRTDDYEMLKARLRVQGAVVIRPLTREGIIAFLTEINPRLGQVSTALEADPALWELITTPLMLNIMTLAYPRDEATQVIADAQEKRLRARLFDAYLVEVLARRRTHEPRHRVADVLQGVSLLARVSQRVDSGAVVPPSSTFTGLDDDLLIERRHLVDFPVFALLAIVAAALTSEAAGWAAAWVAGLIVIWLGTIDGLSLHRPKITVPMFLLGAGWALTAAGVMYAIGHTLIRGIQFLGDDRRLLIGVGLVCLASVGIAAWHRDQARDDFNLALGVSAFAALLLVAAWFLGGSGPLAQASVITYTVMSCAVIFAGGDMVRPSPSADATSSYGLALLAVGATGTLLLPMVTADSVWGNFAPFSAGLLLGVLLAFSLVQVEHVFFGLSVFVAFMVCRHPNPWRRSSLRFAADRSLLVKVGDEYRFVHLLIRDHLATCDPLALARVVETRRATVSTAGPAPTFTSGPST